MFEFRRFYPVAQRFNEKDSMIDALTFAVFFSTIVIVFWQPFESAGRGTTQQRQQSSPLPAWIFPVVWTTLYALISANLIHYILADTHNSELFEAALPIVLVNLVLNKSWTFLFFGLRLVWVSAACAALIALTAIALLVVEVKDGEPWWSVTFLLGPYILWSAFATGLTIYIGSSNYYRVATAAAERHLQQMRRISTAKVHLNR